MPLLLITLARSRSLSLSPAPPPLSLEPSEGDLPIMDSRGVSSTASASTAAAGRRLFLSGWVQFFV